MRHPHADLIKEWAEDTSRFVQYRDPTDAYDWEDCGNQPSWRPDFEYRFKPELKPDVVLYRKVHYDIGWTKAAPDANVKLTFDGETGKLKSAEVIE